MQRINNYGLTVALFFSGAVVATGASAHEDVVEPSSAEFLTSVDDALLALDTQDYFGQLLLPGFGARLNDADVGQLVANVSRKGLLPSAINNFGRGDPNLMYDIILQPGHFGRASGATGSQGARISERDFAAHIVSEVAGRLSEDNVNVIVIPADDFARPLKSKIFLAVHLDGSDSPCASAPSMGYDDHTDVLGVHAIGFALAAALNYDYNEFMDDGFTANLRNYYAFNHMQSSSFGGVIELGELSCPEEEELLLRSEQNLIRNFHVALSAMLHMLEE